MGSVVFIVSYYTSSPCVQILELSSCEDGASHKRRISVPDSCYLFFHGSLGFYFYLCNFQIEILFISHISFVNLNHSSSWLVLSVLRIVIMNFVTEFINILMFSHYSSNLYSLAYLVGWVRDHHDIGGILGREKLVLEL